MHVMEIEAPSNEPGWDEKWCAQEKNGKKKTQKENEANS